MAEKNNQVKQCKYIKKCGGCSRMGVPYEEQLKEKQDYCVKLFSEFRKPETIIGMENPFYYRNKVHHVFGRLKGEIIAGCYEEKSHRVVNISECFIEDKKCQEIAETVKSLLPSFKIKIYDEDTGFGLFRHVLIRRGFVTGEIMVVLVLANPVMPGKNNFVKALRNRHPEITTIVLNINDANTSMVLGEREEVLYGPGFIKDELCGCKFRISAKSFYQVNPVQTEILYKTAMDYAALSKKDVVIDAYCGTGTIGLIAAKKAKEVIGIELNPDAVKDARINAKANNITNASFIRGDATEVMEQMAAEGKTADVVFMDPPRAGSTERFINAVNSIKPRRVVYISCGPETLKRDLKLFKKLDFHVKKIQPVDMFPHAASHVETVVLLDKYTVKNER